MLRVLLVLTVLVIAVLPPRCEASGGKAREVVVRIAWRMLTESQQRKIEFLTRTDRLAMLANWADWEIPLRPSTRRWHYVNIPRGAKAYDEQRDCRQGCALSVLDSLSDAIRDNLPGINAALLYYIGIYADLAQPFHAIDDGDYGANDVLVSYRNAPISLAAFWSDALMEEDARSAQAIADSLFAAPAAANISDPLTLVNAGHQLAEQFYLNRGTNISEDYAKQARSTISDRLRETGLALGVQLSIMLR